MPLAFVQLSEFRQPLGFLMFLTTIMAENKRPPFDLPEGESELIAGYFLEYSGMRFGLFFMSEFIEVVVIAGLVTTLFLGGWSIPYLSTETIVGAIGPVFNEVARVDWSEHLPKLTAFWCRALLDLPGYVGNPFRAHAEVHEQRPFTPAHFQRWLSLFHETLDIGWIGPNAQRAHQLADNVARVHSQHLIGEAVTVAR